MIKKIAIIGAGGFGREVKMLIDQINEKKNEWELVGFFDDGIEKCQLVNEIQCLGVVESLNDITYPLFVVLAIGEPQTKKCVFEKITNKNISYATLIHPTAILGSDSVLIGEGTIITAGVIITVNISIGKHVILNLCSTVGHDTIIGDFSSFMPSVNISGEVVINAGVYIGTGAKIINQVEIGHNTIVGAGAVVSRSLPPNCTAVGIPAKPIKFH